MEYNYCDKCGKVCDGFHGDKTKDNEIIIQQLVNAIIKHDKYTINEIIKRVAEIQYKKETNK